MSTHPHSPRSIPPRWTRLPCSRPPAPPSRLCLFPTRPSCLALLPSPLPSPIRCPPDPTTVAVPSPPPSLSPPRTGPEAVASQYTARPCSACFVSTSVFLSVPPPWWHPLVMGNTNPHPSLSAPASRWAVSSPHGGTSSTPSTLRRYHPLLCPKYQHIWCSMYVLYKFTV